MPSALEPKVRNLNFCFGELLKNQVTYLKKDIKNLESKGKQITLPLCRTIRSTQKFQAQ